MRSGLVLPLILAAALVGGVVAAVSREDDNSLQSAGFGPAAAPQAALLPPPVGGAGRPVALGPADAAKIADFNRLLRSHQISGDVVELGKSGEHAFYRFKATAGHYCYSVSTPGAASKFGPLMCPEGFPSQHVPLLDMSVVEANAGEPESAHLITVRGFAGDDVARVGLAAHDGSIVASVPVINNTYELTDLPDRPVSTVVPLGRDGTKLTQTP